MLINLLKMVSWKFCDPPLFSTIILYCSINGVIIPAGADIERENLPIDADRINEALLDSGAKTRKQHTEALEEYVRRMKQIKYIARIGEVDYDPDYDYKRARSH